MSALLAALLAVAGVAGDDGSDPYFPAFHVRPPENWINDPNGPFRDPKTGVIHLWMQYNPHGAQWGYMSWYHTVSNDYVHWQHLGATEALTFDPQKYPYADGGFFSGSVTLLNGTHPVIMYTGMSSAGQLQCLAWPKNLSDPLLTEWEEDAGNPVISTFPEHVVSSTTFRDPTTALWDTKRQLYLVHVGASLKREDVYQAETATVVGYTADASFKNWQFDSILFEDRYVPRGMFECPDFFFLPGGDPSSRVWVLKVSTMATRKDYYWLGAFDWDSRTFTQSSSAVPLDYGQYYAAKSFFDPILQQQVLFGWASEEASVPQWNGVQSLPRVMEYDAQRHLLRVFPLPALKRLRQGVLYTSGEPQPLSAEEPRMLVGASGSQPQQEILANFSFPADLFDVEPGAFVGLRIREATASNYTRVGVTANPLGGQTLEDTEIFGASYMDLPMDAYSSKAANARNCSEICAKDLRCIAWTYVQKPPDVEFLQRQTLSFAPRCSLKEFAPSTQHRTAFGCISGFVKTPVFIADRTYSATTKGASIRGGRAAILPKDAGKAAMSLHIFNDHSITESFKDGGLERITSRLYNPAEDSSGISALVSGTSQQVILESAQVYSVGSIWSSRSLSEHAVFL